MKTRHDHELNEQKEREKKEQDRIQKDKAKKEREQKAAAEKDRQAKLAREKSNAASTPIGVAVTTVNPTIDLTHSASANRAVSSSNPAYKLDDIDAPVTKKDIERVDSYRKLFQKSIVDTMIEENEKRDLHTYFSQSYQTGTRKLNLPKSDATINLTLGEILECCYLYYRT